MLGSHIKHILEMLREKPAGLNLQCTLPPSYEESTSGSASRGGSHSTVSRISHLEINKTFINPKSPTSASSCGIAPVYELSHELDAGHSVISLSRHLPYQGPALETRSKRVYYFSQLPLSDAVEIVGMRRSSLPGTLYLQLNRTLFRQMWELWHRPSSSEKSKLLFRTRPTKKVQKADKLQWENGDRELVAVETLSTNESAPDLHVVKDLETRMMDLLVTAWCAHIWIQRQVRIAEVRERELSSGMSFGVLPETKMSLSQQHTDLMIVHTS
ncbi:hypothetical protein LOZ58_000059 [Ophidiomyces ophidiicola]|nr:hypothetical protein LOZ58_000059 [Ophidiomyces ophidiicola]